MKEIGEVTCCIVDTGLFVPMAMRMAESCKRVLYYSPDKRGFPSIKQGCIGDGFENVERVNEFWPMLSDVDLFCFPDSQHAGLQLYLESIGKAVWGSRQGQDLEQRRKYFMQVLEQIGLEVPVFVDILGLEALRHHLHDKEDKYIKISGWRGDMETTHWRSFRQDEGWLDWMAVNLGPVLKNHMHFLVFDSIETDLEIGCDTYNVDGRWPGLMLNGIEGKDKSYFAAVTKTQDMPEQIGTVLEALAPMLSKYRYRNQISMELRVKGDKAYYIDATQRGGMPSTASQHLLWKNFPEIVWGGSNGQLIQPQPAGQFSIETMITSKGGHDTWDVAEIPDELLPWCRFSNCCYVDGLFVFPPDELMGNDLGWLCAIGDTPKEALQAIKDQADMLPDGLNADVEALAPVIAEIESAGEQGIEFTHKPMPAPADAL